jgi:NAD(P)-dependent dehydrogenase (short-subunit alcohol dehydrogenase family)
MESSVTESTRSTVLLVGASRGLGLGLAREFLARGWRVIATARTDDSRLRALAGGDRLVVEHVDIADRAAVAALRQRLAGETLDLLFIVAGISGEIETPVQDVPAEEVANIYLTNAYHPICCAEVLLDLVRPSGTIAFMSSRLGSIAANTNARWEAYRASKAALNMMSRSFFVRHPGYGVLQMSPGWVRTDMGGTDAPLDVETSVRGMVDGITARQGRTDHVFLHFDGSELPW